MSDRRRCVSMTLIIFAGFSLNSCNDQTELGGGDTVRERPDTGRFLFQHHFIRAQMPQEDWFHTATLADLDRDGDLDFTIASARGDRTEKNLYWYEYKGPEQWTEHIVGDMEETQQGADILDVDGDGWLDLISGNHWYRNSQDPRNVPFTKYRFRDLSAGFHDVVVADIDGDGMKDIVTLSENHGCYWYRHPLDPTELWEEFRILSKDNCPHGAFGPEGIGDLDGDGDNDIVLGDKWMENEREGRSWVPHALDFGRWEVPTWGGKEILATRCVVRDLDMDGDNDIVLTECDLPGSTAAVFYNLDGLGRSWEKVPLPQTAPGDRGSLHSLRVADFDLDGNLDILAIDQEDCRGDQPLPGPRWYVWENASGIWKETVILDLNLGGHEAWTGDVDGDGDIDVVAKTWRSGLYNESGNGGAAHADYLENLEIRRSRP